MTAKPLQTHAAALDELKSAVAWYLERSETAANNFVAELDRALDLIVQTPDRWPRGPQATRRFVLQRYPFALIYREKETAIELIAVAHGHRRPSYWKSRL